MTIGIILIILAVLELLLGLQFLFRYQKGPTSLFFGLFCVGSAIYVGPLFPPWLFVTVYMVVKNNS